MRNHIATNINQTATEEYRKIGNDLMQVDGAVQNELQHVMELSRKRALAYTSVIERVQSFMLNASHQIQTSEEQLARAFRTPRR